MLRKGPVTLSEVDIVLVSSLYSSKMDLFLKIIFQKQTLLRNHIY